MQRITVSVRALQARGHFVQPQSGQDDAQTLSDLGSPISAFLRDVCERPEWEKPLMIVVVGRPAKGATVPAHALKKKPLSQIASWL